MRSAVCEEANKIIIKEVDVPKYKQDEVLIEVESVGISRLDVLAYMGKYPKAEYPIVLGSELCGKITAIGKDVKGLEVGDSVIAEPLMPCGKCDHCLSKMHHLCKAQRMLGLQVQGALAEYFVTKAASVHRKDENISNNEAVLIAPLASAIHAVRRAGISIGDLVVILGAGYLGLITLQVVRLAGASVIVMDEDTERQHLSAILGADYVISPSSSDAKGLIMALTKNEGVKFMLDCAGDPTGLIGAVDMICNGGRVILTGWTGNDLDQMPLTDIMTKGISLIGSAMNYGCFQSAIELVNNRSIDLNSIVSHDFEFYETPTAFNELSRETGDMNKAVIKINTNAKEE